MSAARSRAPSPAGPIRSLTRRARSWPTRRRRPARTLRSDRVTVAKTYKLYVGGAFPRSESGRSYPVTDAKGAFLANAAQASRKDAPIGPGDRREDVQALCRRRVPALRVRPVLSGH